MSTYLRERHSRANKLSQFVHLGQDGMISVTTGVGGVAYRHSCINEWTAVL